MDTEDFNYSLPPELIAQEPVSPRDHSRLMVLKRGQKAWAHHYFYELGNFLRPGDLLVLNDTRVIPARLYGRRADTGGQVEVVLLNRFAGDTWEVLVKPGRRVKVGNCLVFGKGELEARVVDVTPAGGRIFQFSYQGEWEEVLHALGQIPLPPYIHRPLKKLEAYQTVYAQAPGSVAAPTAGLHFTPELLAQLAAQGVATVSITLHVGLGTFRPVKTSQLEEHQMHAEFYQITPEAAEQINAVHAGSGRVIAVGTTSVRALEAAAQGPGVINAGANWTNIFIYPGYQFQIVEGMITNFHFPKSTLLMLVSAFAGREQVLAAYTEAIARRYRFYSFGDAMLII